MKKILVTLGIICLTVLSAQANIRISFKGRCPTFADSIKNCCGSIITDSEGNLTCTEICDSGEVCTPAGCCENGTDVYRNASGAYQCCKGTVCGTNCCESGQECMEGNCCQTGQFLCNGECQDKPTVNENNCEKLSEDECSVISKCTDGQECDGAGNCVDENTCEEGQKSCGSGDSTWCCPSDNECGTSTGECCNTDKTKCCSGNKPYAFRKKSSSCSEEDPTNCTVITTDTYECCLCPGDLVYNTKSGQCETCFDGEKASCTTCIACDRHCDDWGDCMGRCPDDLRPDQSYTVLEVHRGMWCPNRTVGKYFAPPYDLCPEDESDSCCFPVSNERCCPVGSATIVERAPLFPAWEDCHEWDHLGEEYKGAGTMIYRTCEGGIVED